MIIPTNDVRKKKVLIVDDDQSISQLLAILLQIKGYEVQIAHCGREAIDLAFHSNMDLILLDLILPDVEGLEVCRQIREEKSTHQVPIIILSASYLSEDKIEGLHLGADDYLTKPFDNEELFARIEAVLRRHGAPFLDNTEETARSIILELRKIVDQQLIVPFFQPIYLLKSMKLLGLEVLSRPHTDSILINPELLFKAAVQYGCYSELEIVVWKKALKAISSLLAPEEKIFLNCNPYLIEGKAFEKVKKVFEEYAMLNSNIVIEITERSSITDFKSFYKSLSYYRDYGFSIALDDVGGGYASLESLVEIKPEIVKINGHIVSGLKKDAFKQSIVKFLVAFCKERNIICVAEGIETQEDLDMVIESGVDAGQGYFLCKPTPQLDFTALRKSA